MKTFSRVISNAFATIITNEVGEPVIRFNSKIYLTNTDLEEDSLLSGEKFNQLIENNAFVSSCQKEVLQHIALSLKVAKQIAEYSDAHPESPMYINYTTTFGHNNGGCNELCEIVTFR